MAFPRCCYITCILIVQLLYFATVQSCGQFEYQRSKRSRTCVPCRICPKGVHQGGSGVQINEECQNKNKGFLPNYMGENVVAWCIDPEYPTPWCERWTDDHGQVECDAQNGTISSVCKLMCNHGYIVNSLDVKSMCDGNLNWTPTRPVCITNNCSQYEVDHGSVICPVGKVTEGQLCNITCDDGFYLLKDDTPTCQMNDDRQLEWNRPLPLECHKVDVKDEESRGKEDKVTGGYGMTIGIIVGVTVGVPVVIGIIVGIIFWKKGRICQNCKDPERLKNNNDSSQSSFALSSKNSFASNNSVDSSSVGSSSLSTSNKHPGACDSSRTNSNKVDMSKHPDSSVDNLSNTSVDNDSGRCTELDPFIRGNDKPNYHNTSVLDTSPVGNTVLNLPEWTNENAGYEHLRRVIEDRTMMKELEKYLNREQRPGRVTWHMMAEKLNGDTTIDIQHQEYKDKSSACYLVLSKLHQSSPDSSLKDVMEYFRTTINDLKEGTEEYKTHVRLIYQMFNVGNGHSMNNNVNNHQC